MITLTTDFGMSEYVGIMKGVILRINPNAEIIDITHNISPQNVREGAFVLYSALPYFPWGVHVGIVDPGVGSERRGIIIECKRAVLVGPDNGLLIPAAKRLGLEKVYMIERGEFTLEEISDTFHGRDIFAPVSAYLSKGIEPEQIGTEVSGFVDLDFGVPIENDREIKGRIIHIDRFGNVITNIPSEIMMKRFSFGDRMYAIIKGKECTLRLLRAYALGRKNELIATISSSKFLELSVVEGSAKDMLGVNIDDDVSLRFVFNQ